MTAPHMGRRILVLDDEKRNRGLTRATFSSLDVEVLTARDPEQAREILSAADTDVFVTDARISGVDFLAAVRKRLPDLPIIVMIGHNDGNLVTDTQLASTRDAARRSRSAITDGFKGVPLVGAWWFQIAHYV